MRWRRSRVVEWSPAQLPCAPRPINGELLGSWLRRVAAANDLTLPEIEACIGNRLGEEEGSAIPNFRPPKQWRLEVSALTRVPERWVWVLGLDQHFPAAGSDSFVHEHTTPYGLGASFCPECFQEQIATKETAAHQGGMGSGDDNPLFPAPSASVSVVPMVWPG